MPKKYLWDDRVACTHCNHYVWIRNDIPFCQNKESPYYAHHVAKNKSESVGAQLYLEEEIRGCKQIDFNGEKIPHYVFKKIPSDSFLREIPPEEIVKMPLLVKLFYKVFPKKLDLDSDLTVEILAKREESGFNEFVDVLKKQDKK